MKGREYISQMGLTTRVTLPINSGLVTLVPHNLYGRYFWFVYTRRAELRDAETGELYYTWFLPDTDGSSLRLTADMGGQTLALATRFNVYLVDVWKVTENINLYDVDEG